MTSFNNNPLSQGTVFWGGVEVGGTKFICVVASDPEHIYARATIPTQTPSMTIPKVLGFFRQAQLDVGRLHAIGVASFGPLNLDIASPRYGSITATPKVAWRGFNWTTQFQTALGIPIKIETDVNCAALGEWKWGGARGLKDFIYLTVGTGIGGGAILGGNVFHGRLHPEMGHMRVPHDASIDAFPGICPFHGDCLEGLASGPAIEKRWGLKPQDLPPEHPAWDLEATYLAYALVNLVCCLSPQRIILGGGVMRQTKLFDLIRRRVTNLIGGYLDLPSMEEFIIPPGLGEQSGVLGAVALAQQAIEESESG